MKNLIICGDSFSVGIGCSDLRTQPYGSLLSDKLGLNLFNLAKGSSTNLSIFLQVKYAIENIRDIEYLIVGAFVSCVILENDIAIIVYCYKKVK